MCVTGPILLLFWLSMYLWLLNLSRGRNVGFLSFSICVVFLNLCWTLVTKPFGQQGCCQEQSPAWCDNCLSSLSLSVVDLSPSLKDRSSSDGAWCLLCHALLLYCSFVLFFWPVPLASACPGWKTLLGSTYLLYLKENIDLSHYLTNRPALFQCTDLFYFLSLPLLTFNFIFLPNLHLPLHTPPFLSPPTPPPTPFIHLLPPHMVMWDLLLH